MLWYGFIFFIVFFFFICMYIRVKYRFWAIQPVFHIYDLYWYLFPCGIISHELPQKNKYCNMESIEWIKGNENISSYQWTTMVRFLQKNYMYENQSKDNYFQPTVSYFSPYFQGHSHPCFFSLYWKPSYLFEKTSSEPIPSQTLIGMMTTRPLSITINEGNIHSCFDVYYVDYLCVDRQSRKQGIAPQLIQTHEYLQRHTNQQIQVSLFKREGELTGIVPLCIYKTYGYELNQPFFQSSTIIPFHPSWKLVNITTQTFYLLMDCLQIESERFHFVGIPETGNILKLIQTYNWFVYVLIDSEEEIQFIYFFTKTCTLIEKENEVLSLTATIQCENTNQKKYRKETKEKNGIQGLLQSIHLIQQKHKRFQYLTIEDKADNGFIVNHFKKMKIKPHLKSPTAYFFYNFAYSTFSSYKVLLLH